MMSSILEDVDVKTFIENTGIAQSDQQMIESLAQYSLFALNPFRDYFLDYREHAVAHLEKDLVLWQKDLDVDMHNDLLREKIEIGQWYLELCRSYGWSTANYLQKILLRIKK